MKGFPPRLTVAIPTHQMEDYDALFRRCLDSLWNQSFQDFEIVVSDNSDNHDIRRICEWYKIGINYVHNSRKGMAQNTNQAIKMSRGKLIKILYMDDFMAHDGALEKIVKNFTGDWMVSGCRHTTDGQEFFNTHHPVYSENIHTGNNTIGSPSVLTIRNEDPLLFDEEMQWLLDADYYHRLHERYGEPTILKDVNVIIGLGQHQLTNILSDEQKHNEFVYINKKYQ